MKSLNKMIWSSIEGDETSSNNVVMPMSVNCGGGTGGCYICYRTIPF